eukprot:31212-Eustigmatos_ZCMA.PRE.1
MALLRVQELKREQQERQDAETRHRLEVEKVERRAEAVTEERKVGGISLVCRYQGFTGALAGKDAAF